MIAETVRVTIDQRQLILHMYFSQYSRMFMMASFLTLRRVLALQALVPITGAPSLAHIR